MDEKEVSFWLKFLADELKRYEEGFVSNLYRAKVVARALDKHFVQKG